jgi:hypothetical protein
MWPAGWLGVADAGGVRFGVPIRSDFWGQIGFWRR